VASRKLSVDVRNVAKEHFTITVQFKNTWLVKFGLMFIKFGCWISGVNYVEEFPMSLIQNDEPVEMDK
jgi:hypothetical protein